MSVPRYDDSLICYESLSVFAPRMPVPEMGTLIRSALVQGIFKGAQKNACWLGTFQVYTDFGGIPVGHPSSVYSMDIYWYPDHGYQMRKPWQTPHTPSLIRAMQEALEAAERMRALVK